MFTPQEIIQQLIENSATFSNKTEYAQDKYIKKKKKKWVLQRPRSRPCPVFWRFLFVLGMRTLWRFWGRPAGSWPWCTTAVNRERSGESSERADGGNKNFMLVFPWDAAIYATTLLPRCWRWQTSTPTARFWCLRPVPDSCWDPLWSEWEVVLWCGHEASPLEFSKLIPPFLCGPGHGTVVQMFPGGGPVRAGVESFGFPAHFYETLHEFPICHLNALEAGILDTFAKAPDAGVKFLLMTDVRYWNTWRRTLCFYTLKVKKSPTWPQRRRTFCLEPTRRATVQRSRGWRRWAQTTKFRTRRSRRRRNAEKPRWVPASEASRPSDRITWGQSVSDRCWTWAEL